MSPNQAILPAPAVVMTREMADERLKYVTSQAELSALSSEMIDANLVLITRQRHRNAPRSEAFDFSERMGKCHYLLGRLKDTGYTPYRDLHITLKASHGSHHALWGKD